MLLCHTSTYMMLFDRFLVFTRVHMEGNLSLKYLLLREIGSFQIKSPISTCLGHRRLIIACYIVL